ncbi:MAG: DUF86 domain-containing protein [candidate division WOR-3 bacterium]
MKSAIERISSYIGEETYEDFLKDIKTQDAVIRNLEIIGEAVKNLSAKLKTKYKEVDWKGIAGMRDKVIHFYFGIKWDIVWSVIKDKLPSLKEEIQKILLDEKIS